MIHSTRGIVLRTVKYGETSLIVTLLTELFGVQAYMVNGARSQKKGSSKAMMMQPGAILELEVYQNNIKNIQRIKESNWGIVYHTVFSDVIKNSIALYMMELLYKILKQPEQHTDLFYFCEDILISLDKADASVAANIPLFFSLQLTQLVGFKIQEPNNENLSEANCYLDLREGRFIDSIPEHSHFIGGKGAVLTAELLKAMHPSELHQIKLNKQWRRALLLSYQEYYALHFSDFGQMKTLSVLQEVLG